MCIRDREETEFPLSIEQRLYLVGLTLEKVMTFAYKEAVKTLNTEFKLGTNK